MLVGWGIQYRRPNCPTYNNTITITIIIITQPFTSLLHFAFKVIVILMSLSGLFVTCIADTSLNKKMMRRVAARRAGERRVGVRRIEVRRIGVAARRVGVRRVGVRRIGVIGGQGLEGHGG